MLMETQTFAMVWIEEKITLTLYTRYRQGDPGAPEMPTYSLWSNVFLPALVWDQEQNRKQHNVRSTDIKTDCLSRHPAIQLEDAGLSQMCVYKIKERSNIR